MMKGKYVALLLLLLSVCASHVASVSEVNVGVHLDAKKAETAVKSAIGATSVHVEDSFDDGSEVKSKAAVTKSLASEVAASEALSEEVEEPPVKSKSFIGGSGDMGMGMDMARTSVTAAENSDDESALSDAELELEDVVEMRQVHQSNCPASVRCNPGEHCTMYLGYPNCFVPATVCKFMPCLNGGTCVNDRCVCVPPFTGALCRDAEPVSMCPLGYCLNGGTCYSVGSNQYRCACLSTHTGPHCQQEVNSDDNQCALGFCQNGGICYFSGGQFRCACAPRYTGSRCERPIGPVFPCPRGYCQNGGTCFANGQQYRCSCPSTHTGLRCEQLISQCPVAFCQNGGTCFANGPQQYRCSCPSTHTGLRCEQPISPCSVGYCQNGGTCYPAGRRFRCACPPRFTGRYCENLVRPPNPCPLGFCQNGGTCYNDGTQPRCQCSNGWQGSNCQFPVESNPTCDTVACSGDCICQESCRHENGYVCVSNTGYLGRLCDIPVPELQCTANEIIITVSQQFYAEWDMNQVNSIIYMSPTVDGIGSTLPQCRAELVGSTHRITASYPFTQCGTQTSTDVGPEGYNRISFTNSLWINKNFGSSAGSYDMPFGIIRFQCVFENTYNVYTSIKPLMDVPPIISEDLRYQVSASLCKVSTCNAPCPQSLTVQQSAVYTVGQMLHLNFGVNSQLGSVVGNPLSGAVATIETASISCSATDGIGVGLQQGSQFPLLQNGCPTESGVALATETGVSTLDHRACFSFRLPRNKVCSELYIHVRLHICSNLVQTACSNGFSAPRCNQARRKRSMAPRAMIIGPVYVLKKEEGSGHVTFLLDNQVIEIKPGHSVNNHSLSGNNEVLVKQQPNVLEPDSGNPLEGFPLIITACGIMFLVVLISVFLVYNRRYLIKPDSLGLSFRSIGA